MDSDIKSINDEEQLVCYFEDGSLYNLNCFRNFFHLLFHSSVVPRTALVPFSPDHEPYTVYAKTVRKFFSDAAIVRATAYWNTGEIPVAFKWLAVLEQGRRPSAGSTASNGRKRSLNGVEGGGAQVTVDDSESEIIDPLTPSAPLAKKPADAAKTTAAKKKAQPATKPSTASSGNTKVVGRPKKSPVSADDEVKQAALGLRRGSIATETAVALDPSINIPPVPKYNPSSSTPI
jgi:hypothetical protein